MMQYGQFCPIAKATEILGERWTFLIIRELLMGGRRFGELQRGLGAISPALLTSRLKSFEADGLVVKRRVSGLRGFEYHPTPACEALLPIVLAMGEWGLLWTRHKLTDLDFDIELLMLYLQRSVVPSEIPGQRAVIKFKFIDLDDPSDWWLLVDGANVDVCTSDPGRDVDVWITTTVRGMHDFWSGDLSYRAATSAGDMIVEGESSLTRRVTKWLLPSALAKADRGPVPDNVGRNIMRRPVGTEAAHTTSKAA